MKYETHMTLSVGVIVDAPNAEAAAELAVKRVEKRLDVKDIFIAGGCYVDTTEPATITLEEKRRKAEEAWARLTRSESKVGE